MIICPVCAQGVVVKETHEITLFQRGKSSHLKHTEEYCNGCGTILQTPETIRDNLQGERLVCTSRQKQP